MKLVKRIIKWSMLGVPVLVFLIIVISFQGSEQVTVADIAAFTLNTGIVWVIISLITLGVIKLIERVRVKG